VVDGPDGHHLAIEARGRRRVVQAAFQQHFDGHDLVQPQVPGFVDRAHAAGTQTLEKLVFAHGAGGLNRLLHKLPQQSLIDALVGRALFHANVRIHRVSLPNRACGLRVFLP